MKRRARIKLNQLQKDILSNLHYKYKYIARQSNGSGSLLVTGEKPGPEEEGWYLCSGASSYIDPIAHLFPEIKRGEYFEIAELLKPDQGAKEEIQLTIVELIVLGALPEDAIELERDDGGNLILTMDNDVMEDPIRKDFSMYNHLFEFMANGDWFCIYDLLEKAKEQGLSLEMLNKLEID